MAKGRFWHIRESNGQWQVLLGNKIEARFDNEAAADDFVRGIMSRKPRAEPS